MAGLEYESVVESAKSVATKVWRWQSEKFEAIVTSGGEDNP